MKELFLEYWDLPRELEAILKLALGQQADFEGLDWDYFGRLVSQHKIQPLLIRGIRKLGPQAEKYPSLAALAREQNRYAAGNMRRLQALAEVNAAFAREGIRMLSMKGPLLSMELYGDPGMRTSKDLDLMVSPEDLSRAGEVLKGLGYELEPHPYATTPLRHKYYNLIENEKHEVYHRSEICIELHWQHDYQTEQSFDALWERREERPFMGGKTAVMGADDRYPALFIHAAEHGFMRLRWLLDLYELQKKPGFSWERIFGLMERQGVGEVLLEAMLVMYRLRLPNLKDVDAGRFSLTGGEGGVTLGVAPELEKTAKQAADLCDGVWPMLLQERRPTDPEWKAYDRLLPRAVYGKTPIQWVLTVMGPTVFEFELIDLPDWLFWLYFIIRPCNWAYRKLFGGKK